MYVCVRVCVRAFPCCILVCVCVCMRVCLQEPFDYNCLSVAVKCRLQFGFISTNTGPFSVNLSHSHDHTTQDEPDDKH